MNKLVLQIRHRITASAIVLAIAIVTGIIAAAVAIPARVAQAQGDKPEAGATATPAPSGATRRILSEQTIGGGSFVLKSNETIRGDLTVFGGSAKIEAGGRVEGDVNVFGGNADIAGTITGDINVLGGSIELRKTAVVEGGTHTLGGNINREDGASVERGSTSVNGPQIELPNGNGINIGKIISEGIAEEAARAQAQRDSEPDWPNIFFVSNGLNLIANLVMFTLISMLVVSLLPQKTMLMQDTARNQWLVSGGIGVLSFVAVPILIALFAITICLIPLALILSLAWVAGLLIGIAVIARIVGERLMIGFGKQGWTPVKMAAAGAIAIALVGGIPVLGWLIVILVASVGLGALILTRFGTRVYPYLGQLTAGAQPPL